MGQNERAIAFDWPGTHKAPGQISRWLESVKLSINPGPEVAFDMAWLGPKKGSHFDD